MAIAVRSSGSATADVSDVGAAVSKPSGAVAGDVAVATVAFAWNIGGPWSSSAPSGWTAIAENVGDSAGTTGQRISAYRRVIQAGDSSWTFSLSGGSSDYFLGVALQCFSGVDNTTPIDATGTGSNNSGSATISAGAVTIATANAWECIAAAAFNGPSITATGFTATDNAGSEEYAALLYNTTPKATGSTGTVTVSSSAGAGGNELAVIPFALRPAPTPTTGSAAVTLGAKAAAASGTFKATGPAAVTLGATPASVFAFAGAFAAASKTLGATSASASGTYRNVVVAAPTLGAAPASASGTYRNSAHAAPALGAAAAAAHATFATHAGAAIVGRPLAIWAGNVPLAYRVYASPSAGAAIDYDSPVATTTGTTWSSGTLSAGTWRFGVRAVSAAGEELNLDCATMVVVDATGADITARPDPPTGLRAYASAAGSIVVEWAAAAVTVAARRPVGFHVYIGTGGTPSYASPAATVSYASAIAGAYQKVLTGLVDGTTYAVGIRAYNATSEETNTTTVSVTATSSGPLPVVSLSGSAV